MRENADQNSFKYQHFSRSAYYTCEYVYRRISSQDSFQNTPLLRSRRSNTSSRPSKRKISLRPPNSPRLLFFSITHPNRNSCDHISVYLSLSWRWIHFHKKPQQQFSCPTHHRERTNNIPFTGWIEQRHVTTMPNNCLSKLDVEMLSSHSGI